MNHIFGYLLIAPLLITFAYMIGWVVYSLAKMEKGYIVILKMVGLILMYIAFFQGLNILAK